MNNYEGNYVWLPNDPPTPEEQLPSKKKCEQFEYIQMSQLCRIDPRGRGRLNWACEAFGGDRGRNDVTPDRMARAVKHGKSVRKYVLTRAAIDYLKEVGIANW